MELLLPRERPWLEKWPPGPQDEVKEEREKDGTVVVSGRAVVETSSKYNDYFWRGTTKRCG
jgi:hypothetical protein